MLLVILSLIDLFASATMLLSFFGHPFPHVQASAALLVLAKALIFIRSSLSIVDILCGLCMLLLLWMQLPFLALGVGVYLAIKGFYSLS